MKDKSNKKSKNKKIEPEIKILKDIKKISNEKFNKMAKILDKNKNYTIKFDKEVNEIILFNNKTKIISASYNFYGIVNSDGKFMWAYMIPGVDKRIIQKIDKIKAFSHLFENSDNKTMMLYHQVLTQDSIMLDEDQIIEVQNLILYLSEDLYFIASVNSSNKLQLIYISKITEKYI